MISGEYAGGLFGDVRDSSYDDNNTIMSVTNCYNSGVVGDGSDCSGGLFGNIYTSDNAVFDLLVENCYTIGENRGTETKGALEVMEVAVI